MRHVEWDVEYSAFDLFPRKPEVNKIDITTQNLPECDLILCRFVLNHLVGNRGDHTRVMMAIERFTKSGKYLAATNFENGKENKREFVRLDLTDYLGDPIESTNDGHESGCRLSLWRL